MAELPKEKAFGEFGFIVRGRTVNGKRK